MSGASLHSPPDRTLVEAAAAWLMLEDAGRLQPAEVASRDSWLAEDPDHVAAYDAAKRAMATVDRVAADPAMVAIRQAALKSGARRGSSAWHVAAALVATTGLLVGGGLAARNAPPSFAAAAVEQLTHPGSKVYRTDVGQRSTVTLPDGSVATLNTDSVVRIAYSNKARTVRLVRGQALFEVAHDQPRPFEVVAGDKVITALGTVFDVRLAGDAVKVALVEGRVRVKPVAATGQAVPRRAQVLLAPGELLTARGGNSMEVATSDMSRETSWRSGFVIFDETPLAEAVDELNRYSIDRLVIDDPAVASFKVSGAFKTGDLDRFAKTVEEILPVLVERSGGGEILLTGAPERISNAG